MTLHLRHLLLLFPLCLAFAAPVNDSNDKPSDVSPGPADIKADGKPEGKFSTSRPSEAKGANNDKNASAADSDFAQGIMLQALSLIGVTYRWGGNTPETGLDCSGFIRYVFQQSMNIALPHNAFAISRLGEDVERDELKPGDLVFFNTLGRRFSHVGIYLGDDRFIHSPSTGSKIQIVSLKDAYWLKHYNGAKRVTQASVAERQPILAQLMAEERASEPRGKHGKHGRHGASKHAGGGKSGHHSRKHR
ncbi:MAG: C40 family peptidase [Burkholderiales bacterium]|nr:C40 family peptidase [Burkholderiales bacterium]